MGVRLQSKKDSHCESFFVFGLTPSLRLQRRETPARANAPCPSLLASEEEVFLLKNSNHKKKVRRLSILCIKTKITSVSIITTIATSNLCELDSLENLFSRESLRLSRIETLAQSGTAIVVIMKITEGNLSFL